MNSINRLDNLPSFRSLQQTEEGDMFLKPEFDAAKD